MLFCSTIDSIDVLSQSERYELANEWGSEGNEDGQFARPHDMDFSPTEDKLYVVDRDNFRIQVFNKTGAYLFEWSSEGDGKGEFTLPYGLDVDKKRKCMGC